MIYNEEENKHLNMSLLPYFKLRYLLKNLKFSANDKYIASHFFTFFHELTTRFIFGFVFFNVMIFFSEIKYSHHNQHIGFYFFVSLTSVFFFIFVYLIAKNALSFFHYKLANYILDEDKSHDFICFHEKSLLSKVVESHVHAGISQPAMVNQKRINRL